MIIKKLLFFNYLFFASALFTFTQSQVTKIDSLNNRLKTESLSLEEEIIFKIRISKEYGESKPDTAINIAAKLINVIENKDIDTLLPHAYIAMASAYNYKANYPKSTDYALKALSLSEQLTDTTGIFDAINILAINFMYSEDYESALAYFQESIKFALILNDSIRLGHAYNNLGLIEYYLGNYEKELPLYEQAKQIFENINEIEGLGNTLLNIGTVHTINRDFVLAHKMYSQALVEFEKIGYQSAFIHVYESMAENYMESGELKKAENKAQEALQIAENNAINQDVAYLYDLLQQIYLKGGDFKKAHSHLKKYMDINDEIFNEEKSKQIKELQTQYETAKKEAEISRLSLENKLQEANLVQSRNFQIGIMIISLLIILLGVVFFILRYKKQKAEKEAQELQMVALKERFLELHASPSQLAVSIDYEVLNNRLQTPLSEREFEALKLSLEGKTNGEISDVLYISVSTVKFHLRNTYSKMGVGNRKEAFQYMLTTI